ncbi:MAG TPA: hypothetical protein VFU00_10310, partial [Gemmatimonadales bacterium]|nr:hypothetical protein [Gemmatimonadales bacterium]
MTITFSRQVRNIQMHNRCEGFAECPVVGYELFDENNDLCGSGSYGGSGQSGGIQFGATTLIKRMVFTPLGALPDQDMKFAFDYYVPCPPTGDAAVED